MSETTAAIMGAVISSPLMWVNTSNGNFSGGTFSPIGSIIFFIMVSLLLISGACCFFYMSYDIWKNFGLTFFSIFLFIIGIIILLLYLSILCNILGV